MTGRASSVRPGTPRITTILGGFHALQKVRENGTSSVVDIGVVLPSVALAGLGPRIRSRGSLRTDGVWIADYGRGSAPRRRITASDGSEED